MPTYMTISYCEIKFFESMNGTIRWSSFVNEKNKSLDAKKSGYKVSHSIIRGLETKALTVAHTCDEEQFFAAVNVYFFTGVIMNSIRSVLLY